MKVTILNPWTDEVIKEINYQTLDDFFKKVSKEILLSSLVYGEYKVRVEHESDTIGSLDRKENNKS